MKGKILAVKRMQDYINDHLYENISLSDLGRSCFYSGSYASEIFKEVLNQTPSEYIRRLKLTTAVFKLRDQNYKVSDLAFDLGYDSVDGFQRAFRKEFGCNPKEYALSPIPLWLFTPYTIIDNKKEKEMETKNIYIQVIEKQKRKVILKRGINGTDYFSYSSEVGCDVWGLLKSIKSISGEPVCLWLPEKLRKPITNTYVQGVEVDLDYQGIIPEGFEMIELDSATYLMFKGEPFKEENYEEAITEVWGATKKYNPSFIGYVWDEDNPRIQLEPIGERGYIELVPIKKM